MLEILLITSSKRVFQFKKRYFQGHFLSREDLENEFGRFGNIVDIMIPVDYHTRKPKGYCFIEFEDFYQAEDAFYSLHLSTFFGEKIEIDYAKSDWKSNFYFIRSFELVNLPVRLNLFYFN